jgi:hypothetical protein
MALEWVSVLPSMAGYKLNSDRLSPCFSHQGVAGDGGVDGRFHSDKVRVFA